MSGQVEMALDAPSEVEAAFSDGRLSLIIDEPQPYTGRSSLFEGCDTLKLKDVHHIRWVHVMSRPAGGEIRGYAIVDDEARLRLRLPCYTFDWPEMDRAVASLVASLLGKAEGRS